MRVRTYIGLLTGLGVVVAVSYLTHRNQPLLHEPFHLSASTAVPLWAALLVIFLLGFLPTLTLLLVDSVKQDLAAREQRRLGRESESLDLAFRRAVDLSADEQWSRAAPELEVVLGARPEDFAALLRHGEVLRRLGRADEALEVHRRASVLHPRSVAILYQLAEDYEVRGEVEVAREIEDRILREFPGYGLRVLERRRDAALAARRWRRAAELQRDLEGLAGPEGAGVQGREDPERESAVRLGLEYQRGVALLEEEDSAGAAALFQQVLAREPRFIPAAIMVGEAHLVAGDEEAAVAAWLSGHAGTGSSVFLQRIEDHFIERDDPRGAISTLRRLIAEAEDDLLPRFFLGRLYHRLEMHDEALKVLEGLEDRLGSSAAYQYLLGRIFERRGETARALEAYAACARRSGLPEAEYRCRVCRLRSGEWQDRCDACGSWNSVELDLGEAGVRPEPAWAAAGGWDPAEPEDSQGAS